MGHPRPFPCLFSVFFKQTFQFSQKYNVKTCPSRIRHWDSNPQSLKLKSPLITTRPGLMHRQFFLAYKLIFSWAVVVTQLAELSILKPKVLGLNPVIGISVYR